MKLIEADNHYYEGGKSTAES